MVSGLRQMRPLRRQELDRHPALSDDELSVQRPVRAAPHPAHPERDAVAFVVAPLRAITVEIDAVAAATGLKFEHADVGGVVEIFAAELRRFAAMADLDAELAVAADVEVGDLDEALHRPREVALRRRELEFENLPPVPADGTHRRRLHGIALGLDDDAVARVG